MRLSPFAPLGLMELRGSEPASRAIFEAEKAAFGSDYDTSEESRIDAVCFARALGMARRRKAMENAANQRLPSKTSWLMHELERQHGIVPAPNATVASRREVLARRFRLPNGGSEFAIVEALTELLGDDFVDYRPTPIDDADVIPPAVGDHPMNLQRPEVARKRVALTDAVAFIGTPQTVGFALQSGDDLEVGDIIVFDPGAWGLADRVAIVEIGGTAEAPTLRATFTYPHAAGAMGITMPYPEWSSSRRHSLIVLTASAAIDPEKRRIVHEEMSRRARAVSTWDIVAATEDETETEIFQLDEESLDVRTLETVTL